MTLNQATLNYTINVNLVFFINSANFTQYTNSNFNICGDLIWLKCSQRIIYRSLSNFKYIYSPHVWLTKKLTYTSLVSTEDDANKTRPVTGQKCGILALFLQGYYISVEIWLCLCHRFLLETITIKLLLKQK